MKTSAMPTEATGAVDSDDETHWYCCHSDGDVAFCGLDISDVSHGLTDIDCAVCAELGQLDGWTCPYSGEECPA